MVHLMHEHDCIPGGGAGIVEESSVFEETGQSCTGDLSQLRNSVLIKTCIPVCDNGNMNCILKSTCVHLTLSSP